MSVVGPIRRPVVPPVVQPVGLVGLPWGQSNAAGASALPSAPTISGAPTIGGTLTISAGAGGGVVASYRLYRDGVASGTVANGYTYVAADIGPTLTVRAVSAGGAVSAASNALVYALPTTDMVVNLGNGAATEGALAAIVDSSPAADNWTVDATSSKRPIGSPIGFMFAPKYGYRDFPWIMLRSRSQQYATYPGVVGDLPSFHKAAFTISGTCVPHQQNTNAPIFATWGGATSNQNAIAVEFIPATEEMRFTRVSVAGGGTVHLLQTTGAGTVRCGDIVDWMWRYDGTTNYITVRRQLRFATSSAVTTTLSPGDSGTPDAGAEVAVPNLGAYSGLPAGKYCDVDVLGVQVWSSKLTDAQRDDFVACANATHATTWQTPASTSALTSSDFDADNVHWDDSGHAKVAAVMYGCQQALASLLGFGTTAKVETDGDSRMVGSTASGNSTTSRAIRHAAALAGDFSGDEEVGPTPASYGGKSFAVSGMIERADRSLLPSSPGWSYRTTDSTTSMDNFYTAAVATYEAHYIFTQIGINDLNQNTEGGGATARDFDFIYERWLGYVRQRACQLATFGHDVGFGILTEPITLITATGPLQREIYARNRQYHALCQYMRDAGYSVVIGEIHDDTYNP